MEKLKTFIIGCFLTGTIYLSPIGVPLMIYSLYCNYKKTFSDSIKRMYA